MRKFKKNFNLETSSALLLFSFAGLAMYMANSDWHSLYHNLNHFGISFDIGRFLIKTDVHHVINEVLMALFFFLVGMEVKKELVDGEISTPKKASLPLIAAIGGFITPAAIYYFFNRDLSSVVGWGIPTATDIAFALGVFYIVANRVPTPLKIFLLCLAIIDDIFAVLIIALFYSQGISGPFLAVVAAVCLGLFIYFKINAKSIIVFSALAIALWVAVFNSGLHATLSGVILGFLIPKKQLKEFIQPLSPFVSLLILPVFAFANAGVSISSIDLNHWMSSPVSYGIIIGLFLGKPIGITAFSYMACFFNLATLPEKVKWGHIVGLGFLGGIGFTMSLFLTTLSFDKSSEFYSFAKLSVITGSVASGVVGLILLFFIKTSRGSSSRSSKSSKSSKSKR